MISPEDWGKTNLQFPIVEEHQLFLVELPAYTSRSPHPQALALRFFFFFLSYENCSFDF